MYLSCIEQNNNTVSYLMVTIVDNVYDKPNDGDGTDIFVQIIASWAPDTPIASLDCFSIVFYTGKRIEIRDCSQWIQVVWIDWNDSKIWKCITIETWLQSSYTIFTFRCHQICKEYLLQLGNVLINTLCGWYACGRN